MKWIGLTGSIGTGKSTVAEILRGRGYPVADADKLAREAVRQGSDGFRAVVEKFGPQVVSATGDLDRSRLAKVVFGSHEKLSQLEEIIHPIVRRLAQEERQKFEKQGAQFGLYDVPLLFEKKMQPLFDAVIVVATAPSHQHQRLKARNSWSDEEIQNRIAAQVSLAEKEKNADFVVRNDGSVDDLSKEIDRLEAWLKELAK